MMEWLQQLEKHSELTPGEWWALVGVCCGLVAFAGLASGLTLGLMSLDAVDMEVSTSCGTPAQPSHKACCATGVQVVASCTLGGRCGGPEELLGL